MSQDRQYTFAYYCSGHGFGHATRVVALTHELLRRHHRVYICTNAPEHVFYSAIEAGAHYRHAEIDAGIVQPKAYDVARRKTIEGLRRFLDAREKKLDDEVSFLKRIQADAVLVDAPFLPCAAAARAGIPSAIISNFTFDSCYSYLSVSTWKDNSTTSLARAMQGAQLNEATNTLQVPNGRSAVPPNPRAEDEEEEEPPIPAEEIEPLVRQVTEDYANASLLLRLPGCIPIPAFDTDVPMPAEKWTNLEAHSFRGEIMDLLARNTEDIPACTCSSNGTSISSSSNGPSSRRKKRKVINTPLIARPVARDVYTKEKRRKILSGLGIPEEQHDPETTKILVVSFGGQSIPKPAASRPMTPLPPSRNGSLSAESGMSMSGMSSINGQEQAERKTNGTHLSNGHSTSSGIDERSKDTAEELQFAHMKPTLNGLGHASGSATPLEKSVSELGTPSISTSEAPLTSASIARSRTAAPRLQRLMTEDHIYLPGAPPALHKPHQMNATSMSMKASTSSNASSTTRHRRKISLEIPKIYQSEGDSSTTVDDHIEVSIAEASFEGEESIPDSGTAENDFQLGGKGDEQQAQAEEEEEYLIPKGWIAIVCGLQVKDGVDELPENFYAAPRDVYVPDLTAVCDVLLGKLGYGTCSETVSSQTPFVYVPRPLFVEEFGLKRLMEASGTAVPMTRADFEAGNWAKLIAQAYDLGKEKRRKHVSSHEERVNNFMDAGLEEESAASVIAGEVEKFMRDEVLVGM
ncbi:hypothetical protein P389DRAFT_161703 [Cystobasidium minutum MCA 4210]|uniref:uncharacterized protein n=1 Tax=Cystobasidium minutum MCA 4210 TaxID=1397322 RepID=UPI0034CD948F|eukprot:jgi/Rhomi1/161703/estExt_Genewise1Plus.C_5_t10168